ncbi:MAG TPA: hypothetical protein ENN84_01605 [Candidatus Marinimicrobia bacterium]|nr:hypothetical protein [Candidatus Neomarinimicrobiota bacterium]
MMIKRTTFIWSALLLLFGCQNLVAQSGFTAEAVAEEVEGRKVLLTLVLDGGAASYLLESKTAEEATWKAEKSVLPLELSKEGRMTVAVENYIPIQFRWTALDAEGNVILQSESEAVETGAKWFNPYRTGIFIMLLFVSGLILYYIESAKKAKEIYLRPIAGLNAFEEAVGRATEMGKSVLYVPGIMDLDQVETIAGVIILGHVSKMTARYETGLNVPVSRSLVMEASREIVRESYLSEGRPDLFHQDMVHYLTDDQFAFAAGVDGIMLREKPAATFYQGRFFAESLILAETGNSIGAIQIAGTGSPAQLPFFITACDYTLIGEEFFAASAYLGKDPKLIGSIKGQDIAKAGIMILIGLGVVLETFGFSAFRELFKAM